MKRLFSTLIAGAAVIGFSMPILQAEEQTEILYQARGAGNIFKKAERAAQRTSSYQHDAAVKMQNDAFVYRSEGLATAREEYMTWVLSLHCNLGYPGIQFGHGLAE